MLSAFGYAASTSPKSVAIDASGLGFVSIKATQADATRTVTATLDRTTLWAIQTPQAFRRAALEAALDVDPAVLAQATDDAWLIERAGGTVKVVESGPVNFKVTTPHDLKVAELLLRDG